MKLKENLKETYLEYCTQIKGVDGKTIKAYRIDLTQFYNYIDGKNLNKKVLCEYLVHLHQTFKPKTVKRKIASLHAFFIYLYEEEFIEEDPMMNLKWKFKEPKLLPKTIPIALIRILLLEIDKELKAVILESKRVSCCEIK